MTENCSVKSPDGAVEITAAGFGYSVLHRGQVVVAGSLGIRRRDQDFDGQAEMVEASPPIGIDEGYRLPHGKRRQLRGHAMERELRFRNGEGGLIDLVIRAYDDGAAFRYRFPESVAQPMTVVEELTSFSFPTPGRVWIQPTQVASIHGPAYENYYAEGIPIGTPTDAPSWCLPALFHTGDRWVLLAEAGLDGGYFGAHLGTEPEGYRVVLPQPEEGLGQGDIEPTSPLPWTLPWRVVAVGDSLATVVESDLVRHLSPVARIEDPGWIRPGRVSWSWWSEHDSPRRLDRLREYVDLAAEMGWEHTLIDANWNVHDDEAVRDLIARARDQGVGVFLWYNSGGPHNAVTEQPRDRMHHPEQRRAEMAKLAGWGAAGVKVDFFHSDKQTGIRLYLDILEDAAAHGLMVNFHGCTIPRGWSRTWPHLMTMEAVAGAEQYGFQPSYPEHAPGQNTILPFTRNVVGSMDYTPVTFSDQTYPHLTTAGHELALSVVFESGLLHLADSAASYRGLPEAVREFLRGVPSVWDDIRFLDGEPGRFVVLARRHEAVWYVGGINGEEEARPARLPLGFIDPGPYRQLVIADGATGELEATRSKIRPDDVLEVAMTPRGGFVARLDPV